MGEDWRDSIRADAAISPTDRLWLPMRVQALAVADPDAMRWANLTPQYDLLDAEEPATLGSEIKPSLLDDAPEPPGPGIHLHWTLPAAFGHVDQKQGETASFRAVPNRWLVVRHWQETAKTLQHRAWVVESDYLAPDGTNPWLTLDGNAGRFDAANRLGRKVDLDAYNETNDPSFLKSVAPGNPAFSRFYPSGRNVFGVHDEAGDLKQGVLYSYLIVGWFAHAGDDPLSGGADRADWLARMTKLEWSVPEATSTLPAGILCHGAIQGVRWPPRESDRVADFPRFEVAVGDSALDAIAALVDQKTASLATDRDRLLGQLQSAVLRDRPPTAEELYSDRFPERGQLTPLRSRLHEKMFTALPGGTRWEVERADRDSDPAKRKPQAVLELPDEVARMLRAINRDQRDRDDRQRELAGVQRELYAQWYKKRLLATVRLPRPEREQRARELDRRLSALAPAVGRLSQTLGALDTAIEQAAQAIRSRLAADPATRDHVLIDRPMPRYWRANDPILLMSGVPIPAIQDGASPLVCRMTGQAISSLFVPDVPEFGSASVGAGNLADSGVAAVKALATAVSGGVPADCADLLCEALLLDPGRAPLLARIAYVTQKGFEPSPEQTDSLASVLSAAQTKASAASFTIAERRATDGPARDAFRSALSSTVSWPSPWTPVFMIWKARYRPSRADPSGDILEPWSFGTHQVDYRWSAPATAPFTSDDFAEYTGYTPLSDTVGRGMSKWTEQYPEDAFVFAPLADGSPILQSLGGLSEALIMQDAAIQLPPLREKSLSLDEETRTLVGAEYATAPLPDAVNAPSPAFFPIRGGHLDIQRLWIVDTFGRTRRVIETIEDEDDNAIPPRIYVSRGLATPGDAGPIRLRLPPRLTQPSRLLFRWLSAQSDEQEFLGDLGSQPILGWILPNRLDNSLMICDGAGQVLGAIQSIVRRGGWDDKGIRWSKLPLSAVDPDASGAAATTPPRPAPDDIPDPRLRGFVNGLLDLADETGKARTGAFEDLLELIAGLADASGRRAEQKDLSVLVGQPLALVRASLKLDLLGPPAADQSWSRLADTAPPDFIHAPFGVRLGDRRKGPDGLIGYFAADDYGALHLSQDIEPESGARADPYFRHGDAVPVTCDPEAPATPLTLLVDPRFGIHVSSGLLPTKVIDLPPELVSASLSTIEVPLLVAPVLGERRDDGVPNIPLPTDLAGAWTWTWRPAPDAPAESRPITSETAPARSLFGTMALFEGWLELRQQGTDRK